jgi:hypothetical protein
MKRNIVGYGSGISTMMVCGYSCTPFEEGDKEVSKEIQYEAI